MLYVRSKCGKGKTVISSNATMVCTIDFDGELHVCVSHHSEYSVFVFITH